MTKLERQEIQMNQLKLILIFLILSITQKVSAEVPLTFVSAPDVGCLDELMLNPVPAQFLADLDLFLDGIADAKPKFIVIAGDLGKQHWWEPEFQSCAPGGTLHDVILGCAAKSYPALLKRMNDHGIGSVYVGVGDHEIGDNDWPLGSRSKAVPFFKEAFAKYFTKKNDGTNRFIGKIGDVPVRPVGTPYEGTSYAFRSGNILLVVVDEFRQDNPSTTISRRGTVKASVDSDGQLQWLDSLLKTARQMPEIKHIIVFGHMPVLSPVRGKRSSNMFIEYQQLSPFWKTLRKYNIDAYLAGEVHQTTVIKDPGSNIFQITHGGGCNIEKNFLIVHVYSDHLEFVNQSLKTDINGKKVFAPDGTLVIDKSKNLFKYNSTGLPLKPINPAGLVLHYSFDNSSSWTIKNFGSFNAPYDGIKYGVKLLPSGVLGERAYFNNANNSIITTASTTNPIAGNQPRTISTWIRTWQKSTGAYLYSSGYLWPAGSGFRLFVANGTLGLQIGAKASLLANQGSIKLYDGLWHHIAVTFPKDSELASAVRFYIDGKQFLPSNAVDVKLFTNTIVDKVNVSGKANDSKMEGWTGDMDDFAIWASALTNPMITAISNCASILKYNASNMELLFNLYRKTAYYTTLVDKVTWGYASGLKGTLGKCMRSSVEDSYYIVLDNNGNGVKSIPQ